MGLYCSKLCRTAFPDPRRNHAARSPTPMVARTRARCKGRGADLRVAVTFKVRDLQDLLHAVVPAVPVLPADVAGRCCRAPDKPPEVYLESAEEVDSLSAVSQIPQVLTDEVAQVGRQPGHRVRIASSHDLGQCIQEDYKQWSRRSV